MPAYKRLNDMLAFTHECLLTGEDLLQRSLFPALGNMVIAQLQIAYIRHVSVIVPMRWLARKSHELAHWNGGERSIRHVIDLLYGACDEIKLNGKLLIYYEYMMNIFTPLHDDLPAFQEYMEYFLTKRNQISLDHCNQPTGFLE